MRLLDRYLLRQLIVPLIFAFVSLTGFLLLNQIARRFGDLAGKGLPWSVIGEVFLLCIPFLVAMTLPMAILVAVLYALSHLAADNEITAMRASGVSISQLLAPLVLFGTVVSLLNFVFSDQVLPRSNVALRSLLVSIQRKKPTLEIHEQIINGLGGTSTYLRANRVDGATGRMRGVAIYDLAAFDERRVIYADSGRMVFAGNERDLLLHLFDGSIRTYKASQPGLVQVTWFTGNTIRIRDVANRLDLAAGDTTRGDREMSTCEMLTVVHGAQAGIDGATQGRAALTRRDLRHLTGLAPDEWSERPDIKPVGAYCPWIQTVTRWLLPETVKAQTPAPPRPVRPPGYQGRALERGRPPAVPKESLQDESSAGPSVPLTSWVEVSSLQEEARSSQRQYNMYMVEVHKKWALSLSCLVFVMVGIPLALRFPRSGMGLVIGGAVIVFTVYYIGLTAGEGLGDRGIVSPFWAMWTPNVVMSVFAALGIVVVRRSAGTSRGGDFRDLLNTLRFRLGRAPRSSA
ncbi:MAG TPA: LptF/LptG family permease [Gemmatimonadales bacterium]|nr:LptF/LptG family permease [Gemmatimonadales bacterium]